MPSSLTDVSPELLAGLAALTLLVAVLLAARVGAWWGRRGPRANAARARRLGRRGEEGALRAMARAGYRVEEEQPTAEGRLWVDGEPVTFTVRADFLVRRKRRRFVVECKGAVDSASVATRATRRQLREYAAVFDVDGVLLVDGTTGTVREIRFEG